MTEQGWDLADWRCGRCGHTVVARNDAELWQQIAEHKAEHNQEPPQ